MRIRLALAAVAVLFLCNVVHADDISVDDIFTFNGFTWELPASPIIPPSNAGVFGFGISNVPLYSNGVFVSFFFPNALSFFTTDDGGGFALFVPSGAPSGGFRVEF